MDGTHAHTDTNSLHSKTSYVIFVFLVHHCLAIFVCTGKIEMCNAIIIQRGNCKRALIFSSQHILLSARCSKRVTV